MRRGPLGIFVTSSAVSLLLALLPASTLPAHAVVGSTPPNFDASVLHNNQAEDAVAINPTNPRNVVVMSTLPDVPAGLAVDVTFNGGATWTRTLIGRGGDLGKICCDEQLAWDLFGNLWMVYLDNTDPDTVVALSTDGGVSFTKVASIAPTTPKGSRSPNHTQTKRPRAGGNHFADQPSISASGGSVWVSYTSLPSAVIQGSGAPVTGLGRFGAFTQPQSVPTSAGRGDYGDTAVGPNGQVMVTYQDSSGGQGGSHIYTSLDPDGLGPAGFTQPRLLARSNVGGFDYIPAKPNRSIDAEANLAWDRSGGPHTGRVYAIWTQEVNNESNDTNIMLQHSDDNGRRWSPAVRLNDDHTTNSQFDPAIALDQTSGAVAVSWYDCRKDLGNGGSGDTDGVRNDDTQIWATYSTDGGGTFAPNFQVSAGTSSAVAAGSYFDFGDYTHAAFQSGLFYPAWSDNSNSTGTNPDGTLHQFDLFLAKIKVP